MDYSPIPSPAFSSNSGSTVPTVASTIKSNARYQFTDVKNLILNKAVSANVKRAKILSIVKATHKGVDRNLVYLNTITSFLGQSPDASMQGLRNSCLDILAPLKEGIMICDKRLHCAADSIQKLVFYERQSLELDSKIARIQKDIQKESNEMRREAFAEVLKLVEAERENHVLVFAKMSELVCFDIMDQVVKIIQQLCSDCWAPAIDQLERSLAALKGSPVDAEWHQFDQNFSAREASS